MPLHYTQLTYENRCDIHAFKATGLSHRAIAKRLDVSSRTIDLEIKRNTGERGYRPKQAQERAEARRFSRRGVAVKMTPAVVTVIEEKLVSAQWSPEQISGWLKLQDNNPTPISHETIYTLNT